MILAVEQLPKNSTLLDEGWYTIPINALRNIALKYAQTEARSMLCQRVAAEPSSHSQFVMLLDGDFIPSPPTLHARLRDRVLPTMRKEMKKRGTLLVLPAVDCNVPWEQGPDGLPIFPGSRHNDVIRRMFMSPNATKKATGKAAVKAALAVGEVEPFHINYHRETNYRRWVIAKKPYKVKGHEGVRLVVARDLQFCVKQSCPQYEPYVIAIKSSLPRWDERFRGYVRVPARTRTVNLPSPLPQFYNKISYMYALHNNDRYAF